jgi:hypothetical protein
MEEQSCVLLENGRRISAFASLLPFMRGTALTPDPGIKNRQAPCGACRFLVRAAGLEPARRMAMEPKGYVTLVKDFQSPPYRKGRTSFQRFKRYSVVTGRTSAKS